MLTANPRRISAMNGDWLYVFLNSHHIFLYFMLYANNMMILGRIVGNQNLNLVYFLLVFQEDFLSIIICLKTKPETGRRSESLTQSNSCIRGNAASSCAYFTDAHGGNMNGFGKAVFADPQRNKKFFKKNFSRVNIRQSIHNLSPLVIVANFNATGISFIPHKTNAPLAIDTDTPLSHSFFIKLFEVVGRRDSQILNLLRVIDHSQFSSGNSLDLRRKPLAERTVPDGFCFVVKEGSDHDNDIIAKRYYCQTILFLRRLTKQEVSRYALKVLEKNSYGISLPDCTRRTPPLARFFCVRNESPFMGGACGASSDAPVSLYAGRLTRKSLPTRLASGSKSENLYKGATMPKKINIALFQGIPVRYVILKRKVWFLLSDVADVLEIDPGAFYRDSGQHAEVDIKMRRSKQRVQIVTAFGVLTLSVRSESANAEQFVSWVYDMAMGSTK